VKTEQERALEVAKGLLRYNDEHPDVGMGMLLQTAVELAVEGCIRQAQDCGGSFRPEQVDKPALLQALRLWREAGSRL
jgi:hypothetical protein